MLVGPTAKPRIGYDRDPLADKRSQSEVHPQASNSRRDSVFDTDHASEYSGDRPFATAFWANDEKRFLLTGIRRKGVAEHFLKRVDTLGVLWPQLGEEPQPSDWRAGIPFKREIKRIVREELG